MIRIRGTWIGVALLCVILGSGAGIDAARAQPDSVRAAILKAKGYPPDHSPKKALWRAAALPGWGQFYNRQYYKVPFVYAGLAGLAYALYTANQSYILYRHAAIFARGQSLKNDGQEIPDVISNWKAFRDDYLEVLRETGIGTDEPTTLPLSPSQLRSARDQFRQRRDLSIVGIGLFYALTLADAYISAHLLSFNVDDDLAVEVRPTGGAYALTQRIGLRELPRSPSASAIPNRAGLQVRVRF